MSRNHFPKGPHVCLSPPITTLDPLVRGFLPPGTHVRHHNHTVSGITLFLRCCLERTGFLLHSDRLPSSSASADRATVRLGVQLSQPRFFPSWSLCSSLSPSLRRFDAEPELRFPAVRRSPRLPPSRAGVTPSPVRAPTRSPSEASSRPGLSLRVILSSPSTELSSAIVR
jgi:hypothetical protein